MIRAIIVDDEQNNINNLSALMAHHCPVIEVVATATQANQAREHLLNLRPDVLFLDIHMPGQNGFELLKSLHEYPFEVVFVTAYDVYGIMAIKFSALDYLLKPVSIPELMSAVEKIEKTVSQKRHNGRLENLLHLLDKPKPDPDQRIALPTQKETYLVAVKDILRCESSNNYSSFFLLDGTVHIISRPIYEYEELLGPYGFIRCHQSHLVNKNHVKSILNEDSGYFILENTPKKIPISRQKKAFVMSQFR